MIAGNPKKQNKTGIKLSQ